MYYVGDHGEPFGIWYGTGAEKLGLQDPIEHNDQRVDKLRQGIDPTSGEVLRRGGTSTRIYKNAEGKEKEYKSVTAYDLTLSAPKSFSVLWATSSEEKRQKLETAQELAVKLTLSYIEENLCFVRTQNGKERASLTAAIFHHSTSREGDCQSHHHCMLMNFGITESGKSGALNSKKILDNVHLIGAVFSNAFEAELHKLKLITVEKKLEKGTSFEIVGVPEPVCEHFSKRRQEIEKHITPESTAKEIQAVVEKTRSKKEGRANREALFRESKKEALALGFDSEQVWGKTKVKEEGKELEFQELTKRVTLSLASSQTIKDRDIKQQVLRHSAGKFTLHEVEAFQAKYIKENLHQIGGKLNRLKRDDTKQLHLQQKSSELRRLKDQTKQAFSKGYRGPELQVKQNKVTAKDSRPKLYTLKKKDSLYSIVRSKLIKPLRTILPEGKQLSYQFQQKQHEKSQKQFQRKQKAFQRKMFFLYMTNKISHNQYKGFTQPKEQKSKLSVNLQWLLGGKMKKTQRDYLIRKIDKQKNVPTQTQEKELIKEQKRTFRRKR
jgi:conjugative relaxase-like TrwC/TraI family protein